MKIKALIAVRSDSQRVINKNIRPFAHSSLLEIKIQQLLKIKELDGIVVNSNDKNMLAIAKKYGCEIVERDSYFATNFVCMSEVYENMANNIDSDIVVYTNCTNPLIKTETIVQCIDFYKENDSCDSVNTASSVNDFLFLDNTPMLKYKNIVGLSPYLYLIDEVEGLDIDTPLDFEIAEYLYEHHGND